MTTVASCEISTCTTMPIKMVGK